MVEPLDEDEVEPLFMCLGPPPKWPILIPLPKGGMLVLGVCGMVGWCREDKDCSSMEDVDGDLFESAPGEAVGESGHTPAAASFSEQPTAESHSSSFTDFTLDG